MKIRNRAKAAFIPLLLMLLTILPNQAFAQDIGIGFVYIDHAEVPVGGIQNIAIIADEDIKLTHASLGYRVYDDSYRTAASAINGNAALFSIPIDKSAPYYLDSVTFESIEGQAEISIADSETQSVSFDGVVNGKTKLSTAPSDELVMYTLNEHNELSTSVEDANEVLAAASSEKTTRSLSKDNLIIALDPGHGGYDPGAVYFNLREKDLTLKIASYCKSALDTYSGVGVYMTRTTDASIGSNTSEDLQNRVTNSISNGADVIVSLHINSGGGNGAEVYYPNTSSWKYEETHGQGKTLAQNILDKLVGLGLTNRGIKMRDYGTGGSYADGSMADYYAILRHARSAGIPAIIVEHAFIDNPADINKLSSDTWLHNMGEADAEGLAQTYGLAKRGSSEWRYTNGAWQYHVAGKVQTGWFMAAGSWYYADGSGNCLTGWQAINGNWYYLDPVNAFMHRGWLTKGKTTYYLNYNGDMAVGWKNIDTKRYHFFPDGHMATGVQIVDGKKWEFGSDGVLIIKNGWHLEGDTWFYYINSEKRTGWLFQGGNWYWLSSDGSMATGLKTIADKRYYFAPSGAMQTGWQLVDNNWYLFDGSGEALSGWQNIGGTWYYLNPQTNVMLNGWYIVDGSWYYSNSSGAMLTGWQSIGGTWYYLHGSGAMATGWLNQGPTWYYLDQASGAMKTGWYIADGSWYYSYASGAMATGWLKLGDTWYFLHDSGAMTTGWHTINGTWYFFSSSGAMATGWGFDGSAWSQFAPSGAWIGYGEGWQLIDGTWYFLHVGIPVTGWSLLGGTWYYHDQNGAMLTGWQDYNDSRYYMHASGAMATGWNLINGKYEYFSAGGQWDSQKSQALMPIIASSPNKGATVKKMVAAYTMSAAQYPTKALSKGGADSILAFCNILYDEASAEGVDPRVLFCQAMLETGYLRFGGAVTIDQYNFGGLGATDGGGKPASFKDVKTGLRAQVQHLKAYAQENPVLTNACVDPRFNLVKKGSSPYVQHLGIQENPHHVGWASSKEYGIKIVTMIMSIF